MKRAFWLTMPAVTVPPRPKGFPMASTHSPISSSSESPRAATGRAVLASIFLFFICFFFFFYRVFFFFLPPPLSFFFFFFFVVGGVYEFLRVFLYPVLVREYIP